MNFNRKHLKMAEALVFISITALLVLAIIPKFQKVQISHDVTKVYFEQKTIGKALSLYKENNDCFPQMKDGNPSEELAFLTTPIAYIDALPQDPFRGPDSIYQSMTSNYDYSSFSGQNPSCPTQWMLLSLGPDTDEDTTWIEFQNSLVESQNQHRLYNRTNGLISDGDIIFTSRAMQMEFGMPLIQETATKEVGHVQN